MNWPPRSSQPSSRPTSSRECDSGSSSRQETSWPSRSIVRATDDPTRPQPTIKMNMTSPNRVALARDESDMDASLAARSSLNIDGRATWLSGGAVRSTRQGAFFSTYLRRGPDLGRLGAADASERRAAADPSSAARRRPRSPPSARAAPPRRFRRRRRGRGGSRCETSTSSYSSPTSRARSSARLASSSRSGKVARRAAARAAPRRRRPGERRAPVGVPSGVGRGEAACGGDDVVVELGAEHRNQDACGRRLPGTCFVSARSVTETRRVRDVPSTPLR